MTDDSETRSSDGSGARRLIASGAEIAGGVSTSLASAATGLILGGLEGAALGGAAGGGASLGLRWLGRELSARLLSPREEQRLGYVYTVAAAEIAERVEGGEQVRGDGFFGQSGQGGSEAEEVWESILMKSQREPQEKKLPYFAHLLAGLAFSDEIGAHMAHQLTKAAEQLTYRQLCILKLIAHQERYSLRDGDYTELDGKASVGLLQLTHEYHDLSNMSYILSPGLTFGLAYLNPSEVTLQAMGEVTVRLMRLEEIPEEDITPIVTELA